MAKSKEKEDPDFFNYVDDTLSCSLSQVIRSNDKSTLKRILNKRKKKPLPLSADNRGWTALHVAASKSESKDCLEMLLRYGDSVLIDLNAVTFEGETALFIACEHGCEENAVILLQKGCDPKKKKLDGSSALHVAAMKGYHRIVDHMLDHRININDQDWQGFTPLHLAAMYGCLGVCRVLLENEASVRLTDSDGNLPLHLACQNGYFDIVRLLLERDCTLINYQNCHGITPPMLAVQNHNVQCVRYLLDNGAKTEVCNKDKVIALQFAAAGGNKDVLELVLQSTDMTSIEQYCLYNFRNILDSKGMFYSLICCAVNSGSVECLSILLKSELPKSILEAPYAENSGYCLDVFSPLAYLFSTYSESVDETFDSFLNLLLEHEIIYMTEFLNVLEIKWPESRVKFINPFSVIFSAEWSRVKRLHYFNLLNSRGVTPDYCLQCYNNNRENFSSFTVLFGYLAYYKPVLEAVCRGDIETVQLFLANSSILEPDQLCYYLVEMKSSETLTEFLKCLKEIRLIYNFLVKLKPTYFNYKRYSAEKKSLMRYVCRHTKLFSRSEEFDKSNLQQLCRTKIREQLREQTLEDNLKHFRKKIEELPLPSSLKNYLLFK